MTEAIVGIRSIKNFSSGEENIPVGPFFKITNAEETHFGYEYVDGENILAEEFNDDPNIKCGAGGFYFTTKGYISRFYSFGIYLREITIPVDDPDFRIIKCKDATKWRSNKIILGTRHSLFDPETYVKFGLDIWKNKYIVVFACQYGRIDFLDKLIKMNEDVGPNQLEARYDRGILYNMIYAASKHRQIVVLDWLKENKIIKETTLEKILARQSIMIQLVPIIKDDEDDEDDETESKYNIIIYKACAKGHLDVLEWWDKNGFMDNHNEWYLLKALTNKHYHVVVWLSQRRKNKQIYRDILFIRAAIETKDTAILQYWLDNKSLRDIDSDCYDFIVHADDPIETMQFLHKNNLLNEKLLLDNLESCKNEKVFELVKNMGIKLDIGRIINNAGLHGFINILEWAKNSGLELTYTEDALHIASRFDRVDVLNWWKNSGLELKYDPMILTKRRYNTDVYNWWVNQLQVNGKVDVKYLIIGKLEAEYEDLGSECDGCG